MYLPNLKSYLDTKTYRTIEFKGVNFTDMATDGEMGNSENISSVNYPTLSPRNPREVLAEALASPTDLFSFNDKLAWVDGEAFYYDGDIKGQVTAGEKQVCAITDRIIIFPDKKCYDISDDKFSDLEATVESSGEVTFTTNSISITNDVFPFKDGDAIEISGCVNQTANNKTIVIKSVDGRKLIFNDDTITAGTESAVITFARKVPDMDFICEYGNRLWGCKGNTIYGSKLGDPFNFNVFSGISTDSYSVDVGTQGEFTGIMPYSSQLVFFKENSIHRLYGNKPSGYSIVTSVAPGVKRDCSKSLAVISDTIFYYSNVGVMAYTGNLPELISHCFGNKKYIKATAGADNRFYYCCLTDETGKSDLMVYDLQNNLWIKEGEVNILDFCTHENKVCFINAVDKKIYRTNADVDERFNWFVEFRETNENTMYKKGYSKLYIEATGSPNAHLKISVKEDNAPFRPVYMGQFTSRKTIKIPIIMGGSDVCTIRIDGQGYIKIHSLTRNVVAKGDFNR